MLDVTTIPVNMAGLPGISIPCGFVDNMPVGAQLIGKALGEETLLRAAYTFEQATDFHKAWHLWEVGNNDRIYYRNRSGSPCGTENQDQGFLLLLHGIRRRPQHPCMPGLPGYARGPACNQQTNGGICPALCTGCELRDPALQQIRPEKLLLSGSAKAYQISQFYQPSP